MFARVAMARHQRTRAAHAGRPSGRCRSKNGYSTCRLRRHSFLQQHRRVQISFDIRLIHMAPQTPHKHMKHEIQGSLLFVVVVHNQMFFFFSSSCGPSGNSSRSLAFGVLCHFIRDGHRNQPRQHPAGLSARSAYQAPAIGSRREFLRRYLLGGGRRFVAIGLGEFQPVGRQCRRFRHRWNFRRLLGFLWRRLGLLGQWDVGFLGTRPRRHKDYNPSISRSPQVTGNSARKSPAV